MYRYRYAGTVPAYLSTDTYLSGLGFATLTLNFRRKRLDFGGALRVSQSSGSPPLTLGDDGTGTTTSVGGWDARTDTGHTGLCLTLCSGTFVANRWVGGTYRYLSSITCDRCPSMSMPDKGSRRRPSTHHACQHPSKPSQTVEYHQPPSCVRARHLT